MTSDRGHHDPDPDWCWFDYNSSTPGHWYHSPECKGIKRPQECPNEVRDRV